MAEEIKEEAVLAEKLGDMSPEQAVRTVRQLCLQLGQDADSFHGNIWPGNIRFDWDGKAVLGEASDVPATQRTADQVEFLAPEFFWDNSGSATSDVYSLALLIFNACCNGVMPFQPRGGLVTEKDRSFALRKRMKGETVLPPNGISRGLQAVLKKALSFDPEERYISAAEFLTALSETDEALPSADDEEPDPGFAAVTALADATAPEPDILPEPETQTEDAVPDAETEAQTEEELSEAEEKTEEDLPNDEEPPADVPEDIQEPEASEASEASEAAEPPADDEATDDEPDDTQGRRFSIVWNDSVPQTEISAPSTDEGDNIIPDAETADDTKIIERKAKPMKTQYTVQKDFENTRRKKDISQVPADNKKTKSSHSSPAIPILCVVAVLIIGAAIYCGFFMGQEPADQAEDVSEVVSEPYIIEITPEPTDSPKAETDTDTEDGASAEMEDGEDPENSETEETADGDEDDQTAETVTGSATIDDYTVAPISDTVYIDGYGVNLRSGPSTTYEVTKTLSQGTALQRTGTVNGWSQVQYNGKEYYVSTNLVTTDKPSGSTATSGTNTETGSDGTNTGNTSTNTGTTTNTNTTANTGTNTGTGTGTGSAKTTVTVSEGRDTVEITADDSYLRSGPGTGYTHLYTLNKGAVLQRTGTVSGWSRVVYDGKEVYIHDSLIKQKTDVSDACGKLTIKSEANIRKGAGTDNEVLKVAAVGTTYEITGMAGTWYRVDVDGEAGYINRKLVSVERFALITASSDTLEVTSAVNVRKGPGTSYDILGTEEAGKELTATGKTDNGWYQISYGESGIAAYVSDTLVKTK